MNKIINGYDTGIPEKDFDTFIKGVAIFAARRLANGEPENDAFINGVMDYKIHLEKMRDFIMGDSPEKYALINYLSENIYNQIRGKK